MGSSQSVLFTYRDHRLIKDGRHFYWIWATKYSDKSSTKVTVINGRVDKNNYKNLRKQVGVGPLLTKRGNEYHTLLEEYVPPCDDPHIVYYKITCTYWTKTFYIRELSG